MDGAVEAEAHPEVPLPMAVVRSAEQAVLVAAVEQEVAMPLVPVQHPVDLAEPGAEPDKIIVAMQQAAAVAEPD